MEDQDQRWEVSIPCAIEWDNRTTTGTVVSLSLGSALITIVDIVPPEGALLILILQVDQEEIRLAGKMGPKVIHAGWAPKGQLGLGLLGVEFQEPRQEIKNKLNSLIPTFSGNDD